MNLYRGDRFSNLETEPGLYRNNGLRTKAFGSGSNPANIEINGLMESIRRHIRPVNSMDDAYYDVTDFISFSESRERAFFWLTDKNTLKVDLAIRDNETRYLFILSINEIDLKLLEDGIYEYQYYCNPQLRTVDSSNLMDQTASQLFNKGCAICNKEENIPHRLVLINTVDFLTKNTIFAKYNGAIEYAKNEAEWLILPADSINKFRSSRVPRADFWTAEHYKVEGEERPKSDYTRIKGMIYDPKDKF